MRELHISELVEVSGGKFHISAKGGGNPGKKAYLVGLVCNSCVPQRKRCVCLFKTHVPLVRHARCAKKLTWIQTYCAFYNGDIE